MNWPIGWTNLKPINKDEYEYWKKASATTLQGGNLREMWFNREAGAPSQGQEYSEQPAGEYPNPLLNMPPQGAPESGTKDLPGLQCDVSPEEIETEAMRIFRLQQGTRQEIGRVAVGVEARVDRLKAIGNGQVPSVAALALNTLNNI